MYCGLSALNCFWGSPGAATGETRSLREFVELAFAEVGRSIEWRGKGIEEPGVDRKRGKTVVRIDPVYFRPTEVDLLIGDASKARQKLVWESKTSFAQRGEFLYDNLIIAANVTHAAHVNGAEKLMFLGSSCIYPRLAPQPLREDSILTGPLESTNEPYAIAKIAGIKMVEAYRSQYGSDFINVMPTNLYGAGDNYHPEYSHVVAALIRWFHEAKVSGVSNVVVWGTGTPPGIPLCR
jgi:GDP-D-mannose dehydratase